MARKRYSTPGQMGGGPVNQPGVGTSGPVGVADAQARASETANQIFGQLGRTIGKPKPVSTAPPPGSQVISDPPSAFGYGAGPSAPMVPGPSGQMHTQALAPAPAMPAVGPGMSAQPLDTEAPVGMKYGNPTPFKKGARS